MRPRRRYGWPPVFGVGARVAYRPEQALDTVLRDLRVSSLPADVASMSGDTGTIIALKREQVWVVKWDVQPQEWPTWPLSEDVLELLP